MHRRSGFILVAVFSASIWAAPTAAQVTDTGTAIGRTGVTLERCRERTYYRPQRDRRSLTQRMPGLRASEGSSSCISDRSEVTEEISPPNEAVGDHSLASERRLNSQFTTAASAPSPYRAPPSSRLSQRVAQGSGVVERESAEPEISRVVAAPPQDEIARGSIQHTEVGALAWLKGQWLELVRQNALHNVISLSDSIISLLTFLTGVIATLLASRHTKRGRVRA